MDRRRAIAAALAGLALVLWMVLSAEPPPSPLPRDLAHFAEFDRLVKAAWTGDRPLAGVVARDLTAGPEGEGMAEAAQEQVGGALGFVGFAEDAEELATAVARAAAGCGECHADASVPAPPRPAWTHASSGTWLAHGLVWAAPADPPEGAEPAEIVADWHQPLPEDTGASEDGVRRVARAWARCAGCHATETALPE